eukprot:819210-Pelagomonas_calceolata.AAC.1
MASGGEGGSAMPAFMHWHGQGDHSAKWALFGMFAGAAGQLLEGARLLWAAYAHGGPSADTCHEFCGALQQDTCMDYVKVLWAAYEHGLCRECKALVAAYAH